MATIDIHIDAPIIVAPSYFKYRYRKLPSGAFTAYATEASNDIELTGLDDGDYLIEIIYVSGGVVECSATFRQFTVVADAPTYDCLSWSVTNEGPALVFTPSIPSPATPYPCGYNFYFRKVGASQWQNVYYPTMPTGPVRIPLTTPGSYEWQVRGNLCDTTFICDEGTAAEPTPPECVAGYIVGNTITFQPDPTAPTTYPNGDKGMIFGFTYMNPVPLPSPALRWSLQQTGLLPGAAPVQVSGIIPNNQAAVIFSTPVRVRHVDAAGNPLIAPAFRIAIEGTVESGCGTTNYFSAFFDL